jgi:hypothetical protein
MKVEMDDFTTASSLASALQRVNHTQFQYRNAVQLLLSMMIV